VTLDKANKPDYAYEDRFEGPMFWCQSQNRRTPQAPDIKLIAPGDEPVLPLVVGSSPTWGEKSLSIKELYE